jgi:CRISPR-associated protein (TIGR02584 family)
MMKMDTNPHKHTGRHILLCVTGLTPQIITETLYALIQQRRERVDEIRVITTLSGRDKIRTALLDPQHGQFYAFCRDYQLDPASITFNEAMITLLRTPDSRMLEDIRIIEDNSAAANQICEIVHALTHDPGTRLHASAAGGRKTMSIYLTAAMQLFGRLQDRLSHVLVHEPFEMHADFFYIPPTPRILDLKDRQGNTIGQISTAQATIDLADIPFIRLRGVMSDWLRHSGSSYGAMVQRAQDDLDLLEASHRLRINLPQKTVAVANRRIKLTEREFFLYALLACLRQQERGEAGYVTLDEITSDDLDLIFRRITAARGDERGLDDAVLVARFGFLDKLAARVDSSDAGVRQDLRKTFEQAMSRIKKKCEDAGLPDSYQLTTRGERRALRYGLEVTPERIIWEDTES